eukprot:3881823-Prymnesium_polylepis.1
MSPDRSLLLDTYLKLILCHGANLANARRSSEGDAYASAGALEEAARAERDELADARFPAPEVLECDQYSSKARYLVQKLNPDVPFLAFLQGLYKAVVS